MTIPRLEFISQTDTAYVIISVNGENEITTNPQGKGTVVEFSTNFQTEKIKFQTSKIGFTIKEKGIFGYYDFLHLNLSIAELMENTKDGNDNRRLFLDKEHFGTAIIVYYPSWTDSFHYDNPKNPQCYPH